MVAIVTFAGSLSCGVLLCVGLSNTVQAEHVPSASDVMKTDSATDRQGFQDDADKQMHDGMGGIRGSKHIKGELFRVDGDSYYIMLRDDTELRIRTDKTTVMGGDIKKGDLIEAKINDQNHALSIRSTKRK
jgi:hypothetical protein